MQLARASVLVHGRPSSTALAIRRALGSSPNRRKMSTKPRSSSRSMSAPASKSWLGSIRMSTGPSTRKLNPRSGWSSWGELTPRSRRMPSYGAHSDASSAMSAKAPRMGWNLSPKRWSRALAAASAAGSRSMPMTMPSGPVASRKASEWPPPPRVQSRKRPAGCG